MKFGYKEKSLRSNSLNYNLRFGREVFKMTDVEKKWNIKEGKIQVTYNCWYVYQYKKLMIIVKNLNNIVFTIKKLFWAKFNSSIHNKIKNHYRKRWKSLIWSNSIAIGKMFRFLIHYRLSKIKIEVAVKYLTKINIYSKNYTNQKEPILFYFL